MQNPRFWRIRRQFYALVGEMCNHCGAKLFPPHDACPECGAAFNAPFALDGPIHVQSCLTVCYSLPRLGKNVYGL